MRAATMPIAPARRKLCCGAFGFQQHVSASIWPSGRNIVEVKLRKNAFALSDTRWGKPKLWSELARLAIGQRTFPAFGNPTMLSRIILRACTANVLSQ